MTTHFRKFSVLFCLLFVFSSCDRNKNPFVSSSSSDKKNKGNSTSEEGQQEAKAQNQNANQAQANAAHFTYACDIQKFQDGDPCVDYEKVKKCLKARTERQPGCLKPVTEVFCKPDDEHCDGHPEMINCSFPCFAGDINGDNPDGSVFALQDPNTCTKEVPVGYWQCDGEVGPRDVGNKTPGQIKP